MKKPTLEQTIEELSVDGGNIRVRTSEGQICAWLGYKAISLHHLGIVGTSFQDNQVVIDWVNDQQFSSLESFASNYSSTRTTPEQAIENCKKRL